ncbi:LPXTG-motif cell wall anchor domain-containing protein [Streptomyces melanosporofaciens]|uniref:LPXTG-motif cell wall anchor domain-containing protein n=2 Tax=Streptomyces melanosporofaciens TaxID=67327 RepID=A0A1H4LFU0_STRMJ|nr:SCO1860 family LAETG-anchored protein [Streptomyces melanosporofaciens]SEB69135.1 LPXTG-motif cell wall anchor domain-containing protein [Streptomyces melanosporofaciens]
MSCSSNTYFGMPTRRLSAATAAAAVSVLGLLPAATAQADTGATTGKAGAVVLRTDLDVSLLNKTVTAPLSVVLNEVHAPATASKTALTATLDGVDGGRPFSVLRADVATARAAADKQRAEGYSNLVNAKVHVPGLAGVPLISVEQVTSKAVCAAGKRPTAQSNLLGSVSVLGRKVTLSTSGTTTVDVPTLGQVRLDLSRTATTSRTAAATALNLKVSVNPLKLNVSEVEGQVTLARATCEAPVAAAVQPSPSVGPQTTPEPKPEHLAETGGSSATPYLVGGGALLLAVGGGAVVLARRRRAGAGGDAG